MAKGDGSPGIAERALKAFQEQAAMPLEAITFTPPPPGLAAGVVNVMGITAQLGPQTAAKVGVPEGTTVKVVRLTVAYANGLAVVDLPVQVGGKDVDAAEQIADAIRDAARELRSGLVAARGGAVPREDRRG